MAIVDLSAAPGLRVGHRGPTVVCSFVSWPSAASLRAMADAQAQVAKQYGRVTVLTIIPPIDAVFLKQQQGNPDLELPDAQRGNMLKESAATGEKVENITLASALVILPKGIVAVMIRSFIGAMSLVVKSRTPMQTFKDLAAGVQWLEAQPHSEITPGLLHDVEEWLKK